MALLSLGILGNGVALITISLWNLNLGDEGSAKTLKMMTKVMLGFAGKSNTFFKNRHYSFLNYLWNNAFLVNSCAKVVHSYNNEMAHIVFEKSF